MLIFSWEEIRGSMISVDGTCAFANVAFLRAGSFAAGAAFAVAFVAFYLAIAVA